MGNADFVKTSYTIRQISWLFGALNEHWSAEQQLILFPRLHSGDLPPPPFFPFFFAKRLYVSESPISSLLFEIFSLYTNAFLFPLSWQVTDASNIKGFILTV
jgi:hypothetical protein